MKDIDQAQQMRKEKKKNEKNAKRSKSFTLPQISIYRRAIWMSQHAENVAYSTLTYASSWCRKPVILYTCLPLSYVETYTICMRVWFLPENRKKKKENNEKKKSKYQELLNYLIRNSLARLNYAYMYYKNKKIVSLRA